MENSLNNMGEEDLQFARSSSYPNSKPGEAFIQIDSISIDLPNVNSKNEMTPNCEHFSIRKYVSNKRQKENKLCWLFESDKKSGSAELEESKLPLPPLDVPKFRWWQCRNCLHGVSEKEIGKSVLVNKLNGESNSDGPSCTHIALTRKETTVLVSEFKQILKLDNAAEKGEGNSDLLVRVSADESHGLLCSDQKEERDGRSDDTIKVSENGLEDDGYLELPRSTANAAEVNESNGQEQQVDDAGLQSVSDNHRVTGNVNLPKDHQLQRKACHDSDQEMEAMRSAGTSSAAIDGVNRGHDILTVQQNGHCSDELDYLSSDNAEVCPGYRSRDKPGALRGRKVRKVRLLSDLLCQDGNLNVNSISREESPFSATSDASEEFCAKKVYQGCKMKRKFRPKDEYKMVVSNNEANEVGFSVGATEENRKAIVRAVDDDALAMKSPRSLVKSRQMLHEEDESLGLVTKIRKKKKKKLKKKNEVEPVQHVVTEDVAVTEMGDHAYSLMDPTVALKHDLIKHIDEESLRIITVEKNKKNELTQESFQNKFGESRGKLALDFSITSLSRDSLTGREMGSSSSPMVKIDRNPCMCKKKSKMRKGDDSHMAQIPQSGNGKCREDSVGGIRFGLVQSSSSPARILPYGDGTVNNDTSSYSSQTKAKYALSLDYGPVSTIPWKQVVPEGQVHQKNIVSTHFESTVPSGSRPCGFFKEGVRHNHESKEPSSRIPIPNEKQHYDSRFEDTGHFLMLQKEDSGATSKGEITACQEQSTVIKNHPNKISNKASARETCPDDIPMEIVELMAKIQYENSLHDTVKDRTQSDSRKSPSYQNTSFSREYKNADLNLSQKEGSVGDQILPKYMKKLSSAKQKGGDTKCSPRVNMNYPIRGQVEPNQNQYPFKGHGVLFSQYQGQPGGSKGNGDAMTNNYKKSSRAVGGLSACNTCNIAGPNEEPFHLWSPSLTPIAHIPQKNFPQNCMLQPSVLKSPRLKARKKSEEPNKGFLMENFSGEKSFTPRPNGVKVQNSGSSDFCSNEKISALHLLGLMDARSGHNVKVNPRLAKRSSSIAHGHPTKELDFGAYKASEILRHPSSDPCTINFLASGRYEQRSAAVPMLGSSSSLFESHQNLRNGVMGQVPLKVREKGKKKCSELVGSIGGFGSQNYVPPGCISVHNQQKDEFIGLSNSVVFPPKCHTVDKSEGHMRSTTGLVWPLSHGLEMGICTINRNPAEFSVPEVGNVYTIGASDLKYGKRIRAPEWSAASIVDLDRPKRGRKKKIATENHQAAENQHHQTL